MNENKERNSFLTFLSSTEGIVISALTCSNIFFVLILAYALKRKGNQNREKTSAHDQATDDQSLPLNPKTAPIATHENDFLEGDVQNDETKC